MTHSNPFGKLFGKSPFPALQEHMRAVLECAREVIPLFDALAAGDHERLQRVHDRINTTEGQADAIKNSIRLAMPKSLFMPVDRRDLLELLDLQDSIADTAQDIAGLLLQRRMTPPADLQSALDLLVKRCVDTCEQAALIIEEFDELLETGFRGREASRVKAMLAELNAMEDETDVLGAALARNLFELEDQLNPIDVMMWYRLIEWIGDLADFAEKSGNRVRLLIAH
jgi:predicted phosphate transport protein (TIGR00153 family)